MPNRMSDGSITLNILNPDFTSSLTIGALAGPLKVGSDRLPTFDKSPKMDATTGTGCDIVICLLKLTLREALWKEGSSWMSKKVRIIC